MFSIKNWRNGKKWGNWSGSYTAYPTHFFAPKSIDEVTQIVNKHAKLGTTIRVTGAAHSFSPVAVPEQSALTLHHLRGLIAIDREKMEATFYAGTYLYEIGPLLAQHNLALYNMGDIDVQSLAGVVSTGTHGTGITLSSFSNSVVEWGFINGRGQFLKHRRGTDELSQALHVSLGLLGIFVTLTIKVRPLYSLQYKSCRQSLQQILPQFREKIRVHRHVEWYYFPGSEQMQVKTMDEVPVQEQTKLAYYSDRAQIQLIENGLFYVASEICNWQPKLTGLVSKISSKLISQGNKTGLSYAIYPTPRHVKFLETEYAIPLENFEACMEKIHHTLKQHKFAVHFPIECRTSAGEEGYLSPTQGQESAFLAFHMYAKMDATQYFKWVDELMHEFNGRANWGKLNRYSTQSIATQYSNLSKFENMRIEMDPSNVFMTTFMKKILSENNNL